MPSSVADGISRLLSESERCLREDRCRRRRCLSSPPDRLSDLLEVDSGGSRPWLSPALDGFSCFSFRGFCFFNNVHRRVSFDKIEKDSHVLESRDEDTLLLTLSSRLLLGCDTSSPDVNSPPKALRRESATAPDTTATGTRETSTNSMQPNCTATEEETTSGRYSVQKTQ